MNAIQERIDEMNQRVTETQQAGLYFYLQPLEELDGARLTANRQRMLMFASYSYLNLLRHPKIDAAAQDALLRYGTGTHGVRVLAGTLPLHEELEQAVARFKGAEAAIAYSSGYMANLATVSALVGRNEVVICDKYNHASIVDGCLLSCAKFMRFRHNDMADLERRLKQADPNTGRLVVVDAVFSMDGDIINLPEVSRLCREHGVLLMVDEAHSLGVWVTQGMALRSISGWKMSWMSRWGRSPRLSPAWGGMWLAARR